MDMNQVTVSAADLDRAEKFYRLLGLRLIVRSDRYLRFECLGAPATFSVDLSDRPAGDSGVTVYFESQDLEGDYERLTRAGVAFDSEPADMPWLWREARLRDPDGHQLCLFHAAENRKYPPWRLTSAAGDSEVAVSHQSDADDSSTTYVLRPVAWVVGGRAEPLDDHWGGVDADIVLEERFPVDSLRGLEGFSHLDVVYVFHGVSEDNIVAGARYPRNRQDWPLVGIFAQRAKSRPNRIGVSTCRLRGITGRTLHVADLDAIDGTPVLDIKPHVVEMGPRTSVEEPEWIRELMANYWG
jgi:tRNA-Thr(GGU) m(6)t(6)A37 methyltransferase TsaA